ncbi:MAG: hypothetical protein J6R30_06305 [Bacteroidales bacterium]|nr:hypothetical protein [Bacteroidales bacterium]
MKRLIYIIPAVIMAYSCSFYDDSWIQDEFQKQNDAVAKLEARCRQINENIVSLEEVLTLLQDRNLVTSISAIKENGEVCGYELFFQNGKSYRLYFGTEGKNGGDGKDGADGTDGTDGTDGADGADGVNAHKPVISVKQDSDGKWYWTLDGEWLTDGKGNKIPAISNDDVTPSFKIENGYWFLSYDGGKNWNEMGPADGIDGDLLLSAVRYDDKFIYLTMADGTVIDLPRLCSLSIELGEIPSDVTAGSTFKVEYNISGGFGNAEITCVGEHGWSASITQETSHKGGVIIKAPETLAEGKIILFASENDVTIMKAIMFEGDFDQGHCMSSKCDYYELDGTGGYVEVQLTTDQTYTVEIPSDARSWVSHTDTRAVRTDNIILGISANAPGMPAREAEITFKGEYDSVKILIHQKASPFIDSEVDMGPIDGFDDPENGIVVLQEATLGSGTDIVIMGDGFSKRHFVPGGNYDRLMRQAYEDFFSIEPYTALKEYFNVYYINVLSKDEHDAVPYYGSWGSQNGATQGNADTRLGTTFTPGSTSISGDDDLVLEYATQAIQMKGGAGGTECRYYDAYDRAHKALIIVLPNVKCYAGTCYLAWRASRTEDYADRYSIAYCSLGSDNTGRECKYTLLHEAGGHGFGKLADEYSSYSLTRFNTGEWYNLRDYHDYGVYRNVNEYWTAEEAQRWSGLDWEYTTESSVYWTELLDNSYSYRSTEGLGLYNGAYTYTSLFCRPTDNSIMNSQLAANGQFFNAISRWAIWYRVMRQTKSTGASSFKASLDDFIQFDKNLTIIKNQSDIATRSCGILPEDFRPLGTPVLVECE